MITDNRFERAQANGAVTAGNAAGIHDGAAALVLAYEAGLARLAGTAARRINSTDEQLALGTLCIGLGIG